MSYNHNPDWAELNLSEVYSITYPGCGNIPANFECVTESLMRASYYKPRHIPPSLTFNCYEDDCSVDEFTVQLKAAVSVISVLTMDNTEA